MLIVSLCWQPWISIVNGLTENDNFLLYYAGHGELDTVNDRGHWLPVDADANSPSQLDIQSAGYRYYQCDECEARDGDCRFVLFWYFSTFGYHIGGRRAST